MSKQKKRVRFACELPTTELRISDLKLSDLKLTDTATASETRDVTAAASAEIPKPVKWVKLQKPDGRWCGIFF
jgi:hypothetical protein